MAGKSNLSATLFAQKKLFGKANTSVVKSDAQEVIGSNITIGAQTIFAEDVPDNPSQTLYTLQNTGGSTPYTVEWVQFDLDVISGTTYDANTYDDDSKIGNPQDAGPHAYKLKLPSNYTTLSSNPNEGNGTFDNGKVLYETLGALQIVPPNFSGQSPNPYILKLYKGDGSGGVGAEIPLLDEIDWSIDYYNGILFLQDYDASKIPKFAKGFIYVGQMLSASLGSSVGDISEVAAGTGLSGGATSGIATISLDYSGADSFITSATDGTSITVSQSDDKLVLYDDDTTTVKYVSPSQIFDSTTSHIVLSTDNTDIANAKVITAGDGITISTANPRQIEISSAGAVSRSKTWFDITGSHPSGNYLSCDPVNFSTVEYKPGRIDVLLNGQHLRSGSSNDYELYSTGSIIFNMDLEIDDAVTVIVF